MTITLPPRIEQALNNKAASEGQTTPEYLKSVLFAAMHSTSGFLLKLDPPPLAAEIDAAQPMLPLGGGA